MDTISFDKLLLKTAFCSMASDGHIDSREIALVKIMCEKSPFFKDFNFLEEINSLLEKINRDGKDFISNFFSLLDKSEFTENEQLMLIDFAIQTIKADDEIKYSEIKFFKNIRFRLKISDEKILAVYPEIEQFLEEDIEVKSLVENLSNQYLSLIDFPQFNLLKIDEL